MGKSNKKIKFLTANDNIKEIVEEQREHSPGSVESCIIQGNKCFPRHISPWKTDSLDITKEIYEMLRDGEKLRFGVSQSLRVLKTDIHCNVTKKIEDWTTI
jgi:predicted transcriptional regulator